MENQNLYLVPIAFAGIVCSGTVAGNLPQKTRPNIVLMISDDCRRDDFGCYGSPDAITPNIDRLAEQGMKFNSFFQATAMCSPTRHCLLTGLYPVKSRAYPNHTFIQDGVKTLPYYLKEAGYRVALQGKRHIAPKKSFPFEYLGTKTDVDTELIEPFIADAAKNGEPFFLYVASNDAHSPWTRGDQSLFNPKNLTLPPNLVDTEVLRKQYANYLSEINQLDNDLGAVEKLLEKYGLTDNTIFIFTSEQGHQFPFAKWTCYDAGLQTGFLVRWKGVIESSTTINAMCEYVDVTPTLVEIATGKSPSDLDGKSFLPILQGEKKEHKEYVYGIQTSRGIHAGPEYYGIRSVRDAQYLYINNLTPDATFKNVVTAKGSRLWTSWNKKAEQDEFAQQRVEIYQHRPAEELYDIIADPFQMNNLAKNKSYAKVKNRLKSKLQTWMKSQGDKGQETEVEAKKHQWRNK
jgi:uncharacterized sulfatase